MGRDDMFGYSHSNVKERTLYELHADKREPLARQHIQDQEGPSLRSAMHEMQNSDKQEAVFFRKTLCAMHKS